jgi:hypothetical protein
MSRSPSNVFHWVFKNASFLTRPTLARQDAPCPKQCPVSEGPEVYARTTLAGFFNTSYSALMLEPGDFILKI